MTTYVLRLNLVAISERLSRSLHRRLSSADVRSFLQSAGFIESPLGWLTQDPRPLMLVFVRPARGPASDS